MTASKMDSTTCPRGCCWSPFGVCATGYTCQHHARDFDTARARMTAESLRQDLRLQHRSPGDALSDGERTEIEGLRGVETAQVIAARYGVSESTIRSVWARQNKRLREGTKPGSTPAPVPGEAAALATRIQKATGWSREELARQSGVAVRTLYRLSSGQYGTVSNKVMIALEDLAHREGINAYAH